MQGQARPEPDSLLRRNQRKMKALLNELTTREGLHPTAVDGVTLSRADSGVPRTPVLYEPCICVLASGHSFSWRSTKRSAWRICSWTLGCWSQPFL